MKLFAYDSHVAGALAASAITYTSADTAWVTRTKMEGIRLTDRATPRAVYMVQFQAGDLDRETLRNVLSCGGDDAACEVVLDTLRHLAARIPACWDPFDICASYLALENDWHMGGWLSERPSNARRRESTAVQLHRMGYKPAGDAGCSWAYLENDNQRAIYVRALCRFLLAWRPLDDLEDADGRTSITGWILDQLDQFA